MSEEKKPDWKTIFKLSTINGSDNCQDLLPPHNGIFEFSKSSWFQDRLKKTRGQNGNQTSETLPKENR